MWQRRAALSEECLLEAFEGEVRKEGSRRYSCMTKDMLEEANRSSDIGLSGGLVFGAECPYGDS